MTVEAPPAPVATSPAPVSDAVRRDPQWVTVAVVICVVAGVALRFWSPSSLWLDESISASISSLPLHEVPQALRHDGAPPLYALLLWAWERVIGASPSAVRALSAVLGTVALPVAAVAGHRLAGRAGAVAAALLLASSPFAIYYSGEARMYSLVVLLVLLGFLALDSYLRDPLPWRGAVVGVVTGALALTHYWSFFLLAVVAGVLVLRGIRSRRRTDLCAVAWMATGGLLFLPWLPSFAFQMAHTGTPWGRPAPVTAVPSIIVQWCGLSGSSAPLLGGVLLVLAVIGACARRVVGPRLELDLRGVAPGASLLLVSVATLLLALVVGKVTGAAFALRYTSVAFPLFVLVAAVGVSRLAWQARVPLLCLAVLAGFAGALPEVAYGTKTQAPVLAAAIRQQAVPGDVVVYCPDQLGPATSRLLPADLAQEVYPTGGSPARVDWVDYARRNRAADAGAFARAVAHRAGPHAIWLVSQYGYRTYQGQCQALARNLTALRGPATTFVQSDPVYFERASLRGWAARP